MTSPQRHRDLRENPYFPAGDGPAAAPCSPCLGGDDLRKTNPIWPARPGMGAAWRAGMPRRMVIVQNEPNFEVSSFQFEVSRVGPEGAHAKALWLQTAHFTLQTPCPTPRWAGLRAKRTQFGPAGADAGGNCAKQSQTWGNWGIWAKVIVWAVGRPGSEMCKTNPIFPAGAGKFEIRSTKSETNANSE
jgi:hypothetical protein